MKKSSKVTDVYAPNKVVTATVTNTPKEDDQGHAVYKRTLTIKIKLGEDREKLTFDEDDSLAKFLENISFEEEQTSLL